MANDLRWLFQDALARFIDDGKPVIGICNGFQALVRSLWLPGPPSTCIFTQGLQEPILCPVAHGEGRFVTRDADTLPRLQTTGQIALHYTTEDGGKPYYPDNPNGSLADIAGVCNAKGNVFGMMPHPENHIYAEQHPRYSRGEKGNLGLALFQNGIQYAAQV